VKQPIYKKSWRWTCKCPKHVETIYENEIIVKLFASSWYISLLIYRVSQEERTKLQEGVPYVKQNRYNPKHLYPKLNSYGDNGKRNLKLWQLLHTYWLSNSYWNWQEYVVSVMLISVLNIKLTCEWHKAIKLNYKNTRTHIRLSLGLPSTVHIGSNEMLSYCVSETGSVRRQCRLPKVCVSV